MKKTAKVETEIDCNKKTCGKCIHLKEIGIFLTCYNQDLKYMDGEFLDCTKSGKPIRCKDCIKVFK